MLVSGKFPEDDTIHIGARGRARNLPHRSASKTLFNSSPDDGND